MASSARRRATVLATLVAFVPGLAAGVPAHAGEGPPAEPDGPLPGPPVLYAPPPHAPQLENRDRRFRADPLLVSGEEAYVDGEYLYQDFLYDDYGSDTDGVGGSSQRARAGEITYPADPEYGGNAADLVEFRAAPGDEEVTYRFTLNTLLRADTTIVTLAFDTDRDAATGAATLPRDPGAPFPGTDEVITVWGSGAEHSRLTAGRVTTTPLEIGADLEANQLTVTVPRSVSDPAGVWRASLATGLFDPGTGGWKRPGVTATEDTPGGAGPIDPAPNGIFNLGFRFDEPVLLNNVSPDTGQSAALRDDEPTRYARDIDFDALSAGLNRSTVAVTGRQIRMFPSRLNLGEGRDLDSVPQYRGQLQPYSLYIPSTYRQDSPAGLTLSLHSLGQHYWQYQSGRVFEQQGEQRGNLVLSPMARGDNGWYQNEAEYDVFEAWNDVAARFNLDPDRTYSSGYSMGGYGTYRLVGLYPDLFARAFTVVGPPGDGIWVPPAAPTGGAHTLTNRWLENMRNVALLNVAAVEDELVPYVGPRAQNLGAPEIGIRGLEQLEYDYRFVTFPAADHFALAALGYDFPFARDFLGSAEVDRDPVHVSFAYVPESDDPALGLVHDHAYWVSGVRVAGRAAKGLVDVRSRAHGVGDPESAPVTGSGVAQLPYTMLGREYGTAPREDAENALELSLTDVSSVRLQAARAGLDVRAPIRILATSSTDSEVLLAGSFPRSTRVTRDGRTVPSTVTGEGVRFPVSEGQGEYLISRTGQHS
ncbi:hypothetical protein [Amycolatopsis palatopharyngis]|uniref:hypothetical protein n=1 Tax=Amycolatopsis palatopharyngis TaxID=187982 RepID=UPI000E2899B2|nr:hypothetical protein [Amycolatopsis palatopharyngis]